MSFRLPHHEPPPWRTTVVPYAELRRHLARMRRLPNGCVRYGGYSSRPTFRMRDPEGRELQDKVARIVCMAIEDRPLRPDELACHHCDRDWCANPQHLYAGTQSMNARDRWRPGRPIPFRPLPVWLREEFSRAQALLDLLPSAAA